MQARIHQLMGLPASSAWASRSTAVAIDELTIKLVASRQTDSQRIEVLEERVEAMQENFNKVLQRIERPLLHRTNGKSLIWAACNGTSSSIEFASDGRVVFDVAGSYLVHVDVWHNSSGSIKTAELQNKGKTLATVAYHASSQVTVTPLHYAFAATESDEISAVLTSTYKGSSISIHQLQ